MPDRPDCRALGYSPIRDTGGSRIGWAKRIGELVHAVDDRWEITSTHPGAGGFGVAEIVVRRRTRCATKRLAEIDSEMLALGGESLVLGSELDSFEGAAMTHAAIARRRQICDRLAVIKSRLDALAIELVSARKVAVA